MSMSASDHKPESRRVFLTTPGFEAALTAELPALLRPILSGHPPGVVLTSESAPDLSPIDPIFARQQLPMAHEVRAGSVAGLAEAGYGIVETIVDRTGGPFTIHAFASTGAGAGLGSRAGLIAKELLDRLRARRRRSARGYRTPEDASLGFSEIELVIQILMIDRDRAWVSAAKPQVVPGGGWTIAPFVAGVAPVGDDRRPPSRAYRKLEEAFLWMGEQPQEGDLCVDLGGAPGGWSYTALRRRARVIAVDRAPLERPVRGHPGLTMITGNAFNYEPPAHELPVDWLLSDVICEPARMLALLDRWLSRAWCRRLVATVKFKGQSGYNILTEVRAALARANCPRVRIKHLHHNKNEVTVMAVTEHVGSPTSAINPAQAGNTTRGALTR
jgi:FtsJ-like methyltransferase